MTSEPVGGPRLHNAEPEHLPIFESELLSILRTSCVEMALNRVDGKEDLYVGGIWALCRPKALDERRITHVLSMVKFNPDTFEFDTGKTKWAEYGKKYEHLMIDIDDLDDADLLVHLPQVVQFIENGLYPPEKPAIAALDLDGPPGKSRDVAKGASIEAGKGFDEKTQGQDVIQPIPKLAELTLRPINSERKASESKASAGPTGAVFVHCAMGKSRSVAAIVAYLLWKHPTRFGSSAASRADPKAARQVVSSAIKWVRRSREIAEPNSGFVRQLEMWWAMGCPMDVEAHPVYRKWVFQREVGESVAVGKAPEQLRFEDEEKPAVAASAQGGVSEKSAERELRCKKCRRVLATGEFILGHEPPVWADEKAKATECPHFFIEPLSWMRPTLEAGELEGRLACPNEKCGAGVGRYSWKGFKCSCGGWVTPAFSLQKGKVDLAASRGAAPAPGIRMPPGRGNL